MKKMWVRVAGIMLIMGLYLAPKKVLAATVECSSKSITAEYESEIVSGELDNYTIEISGLKPNNEYAIIIFTNKKGPDELFDFITHSPQTDPIRFTSDPSGSKTVIVKDGLAISREFNWNLEFYQGFAGDRHIFLKDVKDGAKIITDLGWCRIGSYFIATKASQEDSCLIELGASCLDTGETKVTGYYSNFIWNGEVYPEENEGLKNNNLKVFINNKDGDIFLPKNGSYQDDLGVLPAKEYVLKIQRVTNGTKICEKTFSIPENCKNLPANWGKENSPDLRNCCVANYPCNLEDPKSQGFGVPTALGCIPTNPGPFVAWLLKYATAMGGGIAFLLMSFGAFTFMTSGGDPEKVKQGKEILTSAIAGLLFIVFAVYLLQLIGIDILKIPGLEAYD